MTEGGFGGGGGVTLGSQGLSVRCHRPPFVRFISLHYFRFWLPAADSFVPVARLRFTWNERKTQKEKGLKASRGE